MLHCFIQIIGHISSVIQEIELSPQAKQKYTMKDVTNSQLNESAIDLTSIPDLETFDEDNLMEDPVGYFR